MEVIIPVIIISAVITYYSAKLTKRIYITYLVLLLLINGLFLAQGYYNSGYIDPFAPIGHIVLSTIILLGCLAGHITWFYFGRKKL
jgi:hypothetical protein|tara:strand:- start:54183 stop:54440 length:258 start_codon:yes stop_codon:yes gene_type:complete